MDNSELKSVADIVAGLGIAPPKAPATTLEDVLEKDEDLDTMELSELEAYLLEISSYNIFLKAQKGSYAAKLKIRKAQYEKKMGLETRAGPQSSDAGGWLTAQEKEAAALTMSPELSELRQGIVVLEATLEKIKDIPYGIDKKIDLITIKLRRRIKQEI